MSLTHSGDGRTTFNDVGCAAVAHRLHCKDLLVLGVSPDGQALAGGLLAKLGFTLSAGLQANLANLKAARADIEGDS